MTEARMPKMGEPVVYVDPVGKIHPALVTQPWGQQCINVVFVSTDESKDDSYGRQIERQTSLMHKDVVPVHGNYWRYPDELPKPTEH